LVYRSFSMAKSPTSQRLNAAKEWGAKKLLEQSDDDFGHDIWLLWAPTSEAAKKGPAFIVEVVETTTKDHDSDTDETEVVAWVNPVDNHQATLLPEPVRDWILHEIGQSAKETLPFHWRVFQWGDCDPVAFDLNRRRLNANEELSTDELDQIINLRKQQLREGSNIWTWDDWLLHVVDNNAEAEQESIEIDVVLEASVPPWDLQLHRPGADSDVAFPPAANCIRSLPEDEDSDEDDHDPSNDGVGSYLEYIYRRLMERMILEQRSKRGLSENENGDFVPVTTWLHCIDVRDLGCHAACHSKSVKYYWNNHLLTNEERVMMETGEAFKNLHLDESKKFFCFEPEQRMNPEEKEYIKLYNQGSIIELKERESSDGEEGFTFPSFEGFFGQCTELLYCSPHVKVGYSAFMAKCVKSLNVWESFFSTLFFGGTISDALDMLDLNEDNRKYLYIRSPIHRVSNESCNSYKFRSRAECDHYITFPFFPFLFYLHSQNQNSPQQPRTVSSDLFAFLAEHQGGATTASAATATIAMQARDWTLEKIQKWSADPKNNDDQACGGEWFEAFLFAAHRDIYDDIDRSDPSVLLQKNWMPSITEDDRKYNIGKIQMPNTTEGFKEIVEGFPKDDDGDAPDCEIAPRVEIMTQILIDIWMSGLVDFIAILQIVKIISMKKAGSKSVVVVYMGSAHTRAVVDFFVTKLNFKRKHFIGKTTWEPGESRALRFPKCLWELHMLFK
jgi:hypothetical protein